MIYATRRIAVALFCAMASLAVLTGLPASAQQAAPSISTGPDNIAIKGYDPVAYFRQQQAIQGRAEFEREWNGARWRFASAENMKAFTEDPQRYAPQFGGFCAFGMSKGMVLEADPTAWTIVDGRLYLKMNHTVREQWRDEPAANIVRANDNWERLREQREKG